MRQYRLLGDVFDFAGGVFANRAGGDRLKPTESGEFANTIWPPLGPLPDLKNALFVPSWLIGMAVVKIATAIIIIIATGSITESGA